MGVEALPRETPSVVTSNLFCLWRSRGDVCVSWWDGRCDSSDDPSFYLWLLGFSDSQTAEMHRWFRGDDEACVASIIDMGRGKGVLAVIKWKQDWHFSRLLPDSWFISWFTSLDPWSQSWRKDEEKSVGKIPMCEKSPQMKTKGLCLIRIELQRK